MVDRIEVHTKFVELIRPFIRHESNVPINDETSLEADLKVNSARMIDIVLEIEDAFHIAIDDASMRRLDTVGQAVTLIMEKLPTPAPLQEASGI
jgi:acyl carrier protein